MQTGYIQVWFGFYTNLLWFDSNINSILISEPIQKKQMKNSAAAELPKYHTM